MCAQRLPPHQWDFRRSTKLGIGPLPPPLYNGARVAYYTVLALKGQSWCFGLASAPALELSHQVQPVLNWPWGDFSSGDSPIHKLLINVLHRLLKAIHDKSFTTAYIASVTITHDICNNTHAVIKMWWLCINKSDYSSELNHAWFVFIMLYLMSLVVRILNFFYIYGLCNSTYY